MKQWEFTLVDTDASSYFLNQVALYIGRHPRKLQTESHGAILLDKQHLRTRSDEELEANQSELAIVLSSLDSVSSYEEVEAFFFDSDNPDAPKHVRLPERIAFWRCNMRRLSKSRMAVRLWTDIPEAVPYLETMLQELGYPELSQAPVAPGNPELTKPDRGASLDVWFAYRQGTRRGKRYTLTLHEIADEVHLSYGWVRQEHAKWKADKDT